MRTLTTLVVVAALCSTSAIADSVKVIRVDMEDALQLPSGNTFPSPSGPLILFVKAPGTWLEKGALTPKAKAALLARLYGPTWEQGNDDGSKYVVKSFTSHELTAKDLKAPPWKDPKLKNLWFYEVNKTGELDKRGPDFGPPVQPKAPVHLDGSP